MQGQVGQFQIGLRQRIGQHGGTCFQMRIENTAEQRNPQNRQAGDQHESVQPVTAQPLGQRTTKAAIGKIRGGHTGVMHADDSQPQQQRRRGAQHVDSRALLTKVEGHAQCCCGCNDSNDQRKREQPRRVLDARLHTHCRHAGVMRGADAKPQ